MSALRIIQSRTQVFPKTSDLSFKWSCCAFSFDHQCYFMLCWPDQEKVLRCYKRFLRVLEITVLRLKCEVPGVLTCVGETRALSGPSFIIFAVLTCYWLDQSHRWKELILQKAPGSTEKYIFYVLAFNEVERIQRTVFLFYFIFFHHAAFFLWVLYQVEDWWKDSSVSVCALWGMLWREWWTELTLKMTSRKPGISCT